MAISTRKKTDTAEKPGRRTSRESKFSVKLIESFIDDLKSGRLPLPKVTIADEEQPDLHCMIRPTGNASFHVQYYNKEGKRQAKSITSRSNALGIWQRPFAHSRTKALM